MADASGGFLLLYDRGGGIGHLPKKKIGHLANTEIPQMADASGGFLCHIEAD